MFETIGPFCALNVEKINGMYRLVDHKQRIATKSYNNKNELMFNECNKLLNKYDMELMGLLYEALCPTDGGVTLTKLNMWKEPRREGKGPSFTRRDLELEYWGRIHDMVAEYNAKHNCGVKPWDCVRHIASEFEDHPKFLGDPKDYKIAVAIIRDEGTCEHKPVFVGDPMWVKDSPYPVNWALFDHWRNQLQFLSQDWTWVAPKPKREFEVNGEKLPYPEKGLVTSTPSWTLLMDGEKFYFGEEQDRNRVRDAIRKLLIEARAK